MDSVQLFCHSCQTMAAAVLMMLPLLSTPSAAHAHSNVQEPVAALGSIPPPLTAAGPANVPGEDALAQSLVGPLETADAASRGLTPAGASIVDVNPAVFVAVAG